MKQTLWNSYLKILVKPHYERNHDQFPKYSQTLREHRSHEVFCWWASEWHFGLLTVKFLLNQITTHKMASLENIVTRLRIIVLCYSYCAYHQNDTLELSPWICHLTPLWRKWWPICKILPHALKSSFLIHLFTAYHQSHTWKLLPWNCPFAPLSRKWCPICKILSHVL